MRVFSCLFVCLFVSVYLTNLTTSDAYLCVAHIYAAFCLLWKWKLYLLIQRALPFVVIILMFVYFLLPFDFSFRRWLWQIICLLCMSASLYGYLHLFIYFVLFCLYEWAWVNEQKSANAWNELWFSCCQRKKSSSRIRGKCKHKHELIEIYSYDILVWVYFMSDTEKSVSFQTIAHYNFYGLYGCRI